MLCGRGTPTAMQVGSRTLVASVAITALAACSGTGPETHPTGVPGTTSLAPATGTVDTSVGTMGGRSAPASTPSRDDSSSAANVESGARIAEITVRADRQIGAIDPRLFGTNVPAWLGPERMTADWFRDAIADSGATTIRMPGGSWSNSYDWVGCELGDPNRCYWPWAARPSDYVDLLAETGLPGIWTVSINDTAQSAAAAVAFFNGDGSDDRAIGVDRNAVDWGTVGRWARLRAEHGHPQPARVAMWEVGNEVFGGRPDSGGEECEPFGWEAVWTCDGTDYVLGDDEHDGYLSIRAAMLEVDPSIAVGAVGVPDPASWSNWGNEVIGLVSGDMDFYVVHQYGFNQSRPTADVVGRPAQLWPALIETTRQSLPEGVPIALTEYNLVAREAGDTAHTMTQVMNALFLADTIGQLATNGVQIANHWNLVNGVTPGGTDYGVVRDDGSGPYPAFTALQAWSEMGSKLLDVRTVTDSSALRTYATREGDLVQLLVLHPAADAREVVVRLEGLPGFDRATHVAHHAARPTASMLTREFVTVTPTDDGVFTLTLPPWSINVIETIGP